MPALPRSRALPVAFVVDDDEKVRSGVLTELRPGGARLTTRMPLEKGAVVALRLRSPRESPVVAARVVSREGTGAWLEIVSYRPSVLRFWAGLVGA